MDKQAVIRRVRIAVSVFFGVLTVALCVLWVRSYLHNRPITLRQFPAQNTPRLPRAASALLRYRRLSYEDPGQAASSCGHMDCKYSTSHGCAAGRVVEQWFSATSGEVIFPMMACAVARATVIAAVAAIGFRYFRRFSLRTMLIATTLVAVVLGLVAWAGW